MLCKFIRILLIFLSCAAKISTTSYCYPDYCQNLTVLVPTSRFQCVLTPVQRSEECVKFRFRGLNRVPSKVDVPRFTLTAYVKDFGGTHGKATAFNLSITDANFCRLTTRYQNMLDEKLSACRHIELYGNDTHPAPTELYVSCPFTGESYESFPYRFEYLVTGESYEYSKQYVFQVPSHKFIEDDADVKDYMPFVYVDTSAAPILSVYIQLLPEKYNVTEYKIWLINNDTDSMSYANVCSAMRDRFIRYNVTAQNGANYFKVSAMHPDCGEYGCANSTTPLIVIKDTSNRLLIMIISTVWIPPVVVYALYRIYKLCKRREALKKLCQPNCLLVYSPTRLTHINVMTDLAKYLKGCNINAAIDVLDITESISKDTGAWCEAIFQDTDIVLVATSPPPKEPHVSGIYRDVDSNLYKLVKENYTKRDKRYYTVQFPYCKPDNVPEEARQFTRFSLPKELAKLVKAIHGDTESLRYEAVSDKELLDSIKLAKLEVFEEDVSAVKDVEETDGLLASGVTQKVVNEQVGESGVIEASISNPPEGSSVPQSFRTNIDELNLLGEGGDSAECGEGEGETLVQKPTSTEATFRIDELNL